MEQKVFFLNVTAVKSVHEISMEAFMSVFSYTSVKHVSCGNKKITLNNHIGHVFMKELYFRLNSRGGFVSVSKWSLTKSNKSDLTY